MLTATLLCAFEARRVEGQASVQQLYDEAQAARTHGNLPDAEKNYLEVIRRSPRFDRAYQNLGIVYFIERRYVTALETFEKALKLNPGFAEAYAMEGLAHYELFQAEQAVKALRKAVSLNPNDTTARLFLGKSLMRMGDYRAATAEFDKLTELKPQDPDVLCNLSLAHMKLMLAAADQLGRVAPRSYQYWLLLARDAELRGADELAIRNYREVLRANAQAAGVHYALGTALLRLGRFNEAAEEFKKELEVNTQDPLALWRLGELTSRTDPREARRYLEQLVSQGSELPQALLAYGRVLARLGETEKAIEQFRRVVQLAPEEDSVHYHLAKAYRRYGRNGEAKAELARFQELARKKSQRKQAQARELIELDLPSEETSAEPEPGFSPTREPVHE